MMKVKYFQGLFVKAVVVLSFISLVPVFFVCQRVIQINSRLLKNELLQKQQTIAGRLAATVRNAIASKEQLLNEFASLHTGFGSHALITQTDLNYLQARHPSLFYLQIFTPSGKMLFDAGVEPQPQDLSMRETLVSKGLQGTHFVSSVVYNQGRPFIWLAQPLYRQIEDPTVTGVLVAALYVEEISKALLQNYPLDMDAVLVSEQGDLLSYNGAPEGLTEDHSGPLHQTILSIQTGLAGAENGEIALPQGERILVSSALVPGVGWSVYVFQPASVPGQLFVDNLFHSSVWDVVIVALVMLLFVGVVSYWVIIPITRPLARLRDAAVKLRENDDFVVGRQDVEIPYNEIGELASVFVEMSQTLHERHRELVRTQKELAEMNQVLEERVAQRTRELKKATDDLIKAERLGAIGQMASIISHEIRNPLAVISNATRLIKTLVHPTDQKILKQFGIIESEIRQANSIINEVLGYARTRELILSMVDVNSYLHELVQAFPVQPGILLKEDLADESVRIKVDAEEIKQTLRNLITNAVEAMPAGGTVTIGSKVGKRLVCLYVADEGPGLTDEIRAQMFSPFFTTKARGTGLGLAVVRKAITRHRGKLFIRTKLGKGTCFEIYLKIYRRTGDTNYGEAS